MPSPFKPNDKVRVVSNRFREEGAPPRVIGVVIEKWANDAREVEVSGEDGTTIAQFVARPGDIELSEQSR